MNERMREREIKRKQETERDLFDVNTIGFPSRIVVSIILTRLEPFTLNTFTSPTINQMLHERKTRKRQNERNTHTKRERERERMPVSPGSD